jgi:hypothetical protein
LDFGFKDSDGGDYFISPDEKYYLRHVGDDPRPKDPAKFENDFPGTSGFPSLAFNF